MSPSSSFYRTIRWNIVLLVALCCLSTTALAANITWTGVVSDNWFDSNNWNPSAVPGAGDVAIINFGTANLGNTSTSVSGLNLAGGAVVGGTGKLTLLGTSTWTGGAIGCTVNNNGTLNWPATAGNINVLDGSIFNNNGTFNAGANAAWALFSGGTGQTFNNIGTLNANAPTGFPQFGNGANFRNTGTVNAVVGTIGIADGTSSGTFNAATNATIRFNGNTHTLTNGARCTGAGSTQIFGGGTVSISGTIVGGQSGGKLELAGGLLTTVAGGGTITGTLLLSGGALSGTINNNGTTNWPAGAGNINVLDGSIFNNNGTFNAGANAAWALFSGGTGQTFNNIGTLNANAPTGFPQFGNGANFRNTGTVNAVVGTIGIADGTSSGTFNAATNATIRFNGNTHTLTNGARCTGAGSTQIAGGGTVSISGSIVGGQSGGKLELSGGLLTTVPAGGTITGVLQLSGGALSGTINNNGTTNWPAGAGNINVLTDSIFNNNGTFNANANAAWALFSGGSGQTFNNIGTLNADAPTGFPQFGNGANFRNTGVVRALSNSIGIGDGTSSGTFNCDANAFVRFNGNTHTLTNGARCTGAGSTQITGGGTVSISGTIVGGQSGGKLELAGGILTTVAGGGTITGVLQLSGGALSGTINNNGTTNWPAGAGNINVLDGSIFNNNGTFNANANAAWALFSGGTGQTFNNIGTLNANAPTGFPQFGNGANFRNTGTVNALSGTIGIADGTSSGTFNAATDATIRFNGNPHTLTNGARCTGAGSTQITGGGTVSINGTIVGGQSGGKLELAGGILTTVAGGGTISGTLQLSGGAVAGTINMAGSSVTNWIATAGNINALSGSVFNNNGTFNAFANAAWAAFSGGTGQQFNNRGIINLRGVGTTSILVPFTQSASGVLNVKIGSGGNDRLQLGAPANLGGTLNASVISPFQPANGDVFSVVTFPDGARGNTTFATVNAPGFTVSYTNTSVDLTALGTAFPRVTSFTPTSGLVGTTVTITGANFVGATAVRFNGVAATFTVNSATQITATVPTSATTGRISVTTPNGSASSTTDFIVTLPAPTITNFTPDFGKVGDSVVITGTNFTGALSVRFNQTEAAFVVNSATQITATVPSGATTGKISVTTPGGTAVSANNFTVFPAPVIFEFTPTIGGVGSVVTIKGVNFTGATVVKFNNTNAAAFTVDSSIQITATVPSGATTGKISVTTPGGTAVSASNFTVAPLPIITSFSPTSGRINTAVTITGQNFTGATDVRFNGVSAGDPGVGFVVNSSTQITAKVPQGATTGKISVTIAAGTGTSADNFVVTAFSVPSIYGFAPSGGVPGKIVTINGTGYVGTTTVKFNGANAVFTVKNGGTITATVPATATTGPITITTPAGSVVSAPVFTVTPRITSFSPATASPGALVTINGANFSGVTIVKFGGNAGAFSVVSDTKIVAVVPPTATSGSILVQSLAGAGARTGFTVGN